MYSTTQADWVSKLKRSFLPDHVYQKMAEDFEKFIRISKKKKKAVEIITDADYPDDLALCVNTSTQAESLLHNLEQAARGIGLLGNSDKTEFMCSNEYAAISLNGKTLKSINLSCNISSTESDVNICIGKAWSALDRLVII